MLNEADSNQGGGAAGNEASEPVRDADALFTRLKREVKADYNSKGQVNWRREAREDFDLEAGEQLSEDDKAILTDMKRTVFALAACGANQRGRRQQDAHCHDPAGDDAGRSQATGTL